MRAESLGIASARRWRSLAVVAVLVALPSLAAAGDADRADEARVVKESSGRALTVARPVAPPTDVAPAHLDGAALEAWYAQRHGAPRPAPHAPSPDVADAQAEAALLADIARRRDED